MSALAVSFNDVSSNYESISKLVSLGIVLNNASNFYPEKGLTRLEFAEISNRIMTLNSPKVIKITDVKNNTSVNKAVGTGILTINSKGQFKPKNAITYTDLARTLAYGLGFKKSWSNRPIDYLFYLERKGILNIDTDLDAIVTREEAAVAIDKYMQIKDSYIMAGGIVERLSGNVLIVKTDSGSASYKFNSKASLVIEDQSAEIDNLAKGTDVNFILNKKGEIAFLSGYGLEVLDGNLGYTNGNLTFNGSAKNYKLNAVVAKLPNNPNVPFTFTEFSNYSSKAGVGFGGTLYLNSVTDEITMLEAYISKISSRVFTVSNGKVTFDFSDLAYKNQSFSLSEDATYTLVEGETKTNLTISDVTALQSAGKKLTGTLIASPNGNVTTLEFTAEIPTK
jgi:hypothetical protein